MAELRTDWLTGRSVLVAENRALRPNEFANRAAGEAASTAGKLVDANRSLAKADSIALPNCPFCVGNESRTPPSVYQQTDAAGQWRIRVVPNMFPAVEGSGLFHSPEATSPPADSPDQRGQRSSPAIGAHEVIIESARHTERMSALSVSELRDVLETYVERLRYWREEARLRYGLVFKNQGSRAGASLAHLHSQLIAIPFVPPTVEAEISRASQVFRQTNECAFCGLIESERSAGNRIVLECEGFVVFCPFASWQPHEAWLLPADHEPSFERARPEALDGLARVLHLLVSRLEMVGVDSDYNLLLRTAPWRGDFDDVYHWRIELLPRDNALAGLEVATSVHINPMPPERAAKALRQGLPHPLDGSKA